MRPRKPGPQRNRARKQDDGTAAEFGRFLKDQAMAPKRGLNVDDLKLRLEGCSLEWRARRIGLLQSIQDILDTPERVGIITPDSGLITRPVILYDKAFGEFIEMRLRGVRTINRLSLAGVETIDVQQVADDWARRKLSGRQLRADGSIAASC